MKATVKIDNSVVGVVSRDQDQKNLLYMQVV